MFCGIEMLFEVFFMPYQFPVIIDMVAVFVDKRILVRIVTFFGAEGYKDNQYYKERYASKGYY